MKIGKYEEHINRLVEKGELLYKRMIFDCFSEKDLEESDEETIKKIRESTKPFVEEYQIWYSEALEVLRQVLPSRVDDFVNYYAPPRNRKKDSITFENYTISDYLNSLYTTLGGEKIAAPEDAIPKFRQQLKIIESLKNKFESSLFDIRTLVQADLLDSELDVASELNEKGFVRASGAVAGVVLEGHLQQVCDNHNINVKKKKPVINDYAQLLKDNDVIDTPQWRKIQHLADLRNLCDHKKEKEPTKEDINELIKETTKIIKTLF
jgi:hypothetical protein